jgi:hypothetical protein
LSQCCFLRRRQTSSFWQSFHMAYSCFGLILVLARHLALPVLSSKGRLWPIVACRAHRVFCPIATRNATCHILQVSKFMNGETNVQVDVSVRDEDCFIMQSGAGDGATSDFCMEVRFNLCFFFQGYSTVAWCGLLDVSKPRGLNWYCGCYWVTSIECCLRRNVRGRQTCPKATNKLTDECVISYGDKLHRQAKFQLYLSGWGVCVRRRIHALPTILHAIACATLVVLCHLLHLSPTPSYL